MTSSIPVASRKAKPMIVSIPGIESFLEEAISLTGEIRNLASKGKVELES